MRIYKQNIGALSIAAIPMPSNMAYKEVYVPSLLLIVLFTNRTIKTPLGATLGDLERAHILAYHAEKKPFRYKKAHPLQCEKYTAFQNICIEIYTAYGLQQKLEGSAVLGQLYYVVQDSKSINGCPLVFSSDTSHRHVEN